MFANADDLKERGFQLLEPPVTIVAVDPSGDGDDRDGVVAVSREEHQKGMPHDPDFAVEYLYRIMLAHQLPQEYEFPDKLAALLALDKKLVSWTGQRRQRKHFFVFETNGVGYGYASSFSRKSSTTTIPYATVGKISNSGRAPSRAKIAMPRLEALDNTRILMETGYLKAAANAPGIDVLNKQMQAFVWRGKNRPEAMAGQRDDLVLALTGALWIGSKVIPPVLKYKPVPGATRATPPARMRMH